MKSVAPRVVFWATLASLAIVLACLSGPSVGQGKAAAAQPAAAKKAQSFRGRLPNYYAQVVNQQQRTTIYKIQAEYAPKIAALQAQLDELTKERDERIAAVLSPQQRKAVEDLGAAAKARREQKKDKAAKNKPAAKAVQ